MELADKCQEQEMEIQGRYSFDNFRRYYSSAELDNLSRQDVPVATLTSADSRNSEDALGRVLSKLGHLDLTGRIVTECSVMNAHGGYCDIFIGSLNTDLSGYSGKIKVAIKRLRVNLHNDRDLTKVFVKELYIWSKLDHPNVLSFKGYMIENGYPSLISEWIEDGTLMEFLKVNPRTDIEAMVLGIAKGLGYLHDQGVVHSDLKADNVLISQLGCPLICDFGISRMITSSQTLYISTTHNGSPRGSTRWMSIELFGIGSDIDPKHTKASDIWAYGMTIYEILTKQRPYAHLKADQRVILAIIRGELPSRPDHNEHSPALEDIWRICEDCWKTDPEDRITISEIILRMEQCYSSTHSDLDYSDYSSGFPDTIASSSNMYMRMHSPQSRELSPSSPNVIASGSAVASGAKSKGSTATTAASTTLSRPAVSLLLSKPFMCPKPGCMKSYKQANGLRYHITYGQCNFAPPLELPSVEGLSEHEAENRLRPFGCQMPPCQHRYKNMNGLRYHYQHSGNHGARGLALLASGNHDATVTKSQLGPTFKGI
ncbi:hypothetical protein M0805_009595 [Coniferiporia weirii]|nr:hypothetical protein M0805_009595 [Coniferiporia weirii]